MSEDESEEDQDEQMEEEVKKMKMTEVDESQAGVGQADNKEDSIFQLKIGPQSSTTTDDGVFTVTAGVQGTSSDSAAAVGMETDAFVPSPRMNPLLAVKNGVLYLYGGIFEEGDRQYTLSDFYTLNLHRLDEWQTIIASDLKAQVG